MPIFSRLRRNLKFAKCKSIAIKSINKNLIIDQNKYDKVTDFIARYEFLRTTWSNFSWVKKDKKDLAIFALVYYILVCYYENDPFHWAENKKELSDIEEEQWDRVSDLFDYPIDAYKEFILNYLDVNYSIDEFEKYTNNLNRNNFRRLLLNSDFDHLVYKYLFVYFYTDRYDELDIYKDAIPIDEEYSKINIEAFNTQIEDLIFTTPQFFLEFEFVQFRQLDLKAFCEYSLRSVIDNNEFFSLKKNFS